MRTTNYSRSNSTCTATTTSGGTWVWACNPLCYAVVAFDMRSSGCLRDCEGGAIMLRKYGDLRGAKVPILNNLCRLFLPTQRYVALSSHREGMTPGKSEGAIIDTM